MTNYIDVSIGELFCGVNGHPKFTRDFLDKHPGQHPVYSASLRKPFGYTDEFQFEGRYLTWVMNGYGGRVQEINGRFNANRDRGVFVPRDGVKVPDLTYLRFAMEPQLVAAAVGRRVDGRLNEYTKIYPDTAEQIVVQLPGDGEGRWDYVKMAVLGEKLRRIEAAQAEVVLAHAPLERAVFPMDVPEPSTTLSLSDERYFKLSIGNRVLRSEHSAVGVPVYSANARVPFGVIATSNLSDFERASLLWGIDGVFDWNLIPAEVRFATTDHCGRLQILDDHIDPEYAYQFLRATRERYGFDRVFRASLTNVRAEVTLTLPIDPETGQFCVTTQRQLAASIADRDRSRAEALAALEDVLKARISATL
ncbi:hypothetical protein GOB45_17480 [Sinorhizobium meliloti]|nr:hypothetical protein [Sinorhizobium meliloti]